MPAGARRIRRRIMQLEIEREALEGEGPTPASSSFDKVEERTGRAQGRRTPSLTRPLGSTRSRRRQRRQTIQRSRSTPSQAELEQASRQGNWDEAAAESSTATSANSNSQLRKPSRSPRRQAKDGNAPRQGRSRPRTKSPRSSAAGPASPSPACSKARREKLLHMEERLGQRVVGQDEAVQRRRQRRPPQPRRPRRPQPPDRLASSSSAPPASAKPSWPRPSPNSSSTTKTPWSAST